jgi:hypothetical protein
LTDCATLKKWECLDSDTGEDLAEEVRKYHIPDFSNWKSLRTATNAAFERAFARLEKDLRASLGKQSSSQRDEIIQPRVGGPSRTGEERLP